MVSLKKKNRSRSVTLKKYQLAYEACIKKALKSSPKLKRKALECLKKNL
jgi:hypothetical protein